MEGSGSSDTLESQKHQLLAATETEAGEVIKFPRVIQPVSHQSSQIEIQGLDSSHNVPQFLSSKGEPLRKQLPGPPKKSSNFAGMMVTLLCGRWPGSCGADAWVSL